MTQLELECRQFEMEQTPSVRAGGGGEKPQLSSSSEDTGGEGYRERRREGEQIFSQKFDRFLLLSFSPSSFNDR
jgi:hypothetical protein